MSSSDLVLDTGALVALQRDPRRLRALVRRARENERLLRTTAPVITEFVGASPRKLRPAADYVTSQLHVAPVDHALARRAAFLMQAARDAGGAHPGPLDALVAAEAEASSAALVFSGDEADFAALAAASGDLETKDLSDLGEA